MTEKHPFDAHYAKKSVQGAEKAKSAEQEKIKAEKEEMERLDRLLEREKDKKHRKELEAKIAALLKEHPDALKGAQEKYGMQD